MQYLFFALSLLALLGTLIYLVYTRKIRPGEKVFKIEFIGRNVTYVFLIGIMSLTVVAGYLSYQTYSNEASILQYTNVFNVNLDKKVVDTKTFEVTIQSVILNNDSIKNHANIQYSVTDGGQYYQSINHPLDTNNDELKLVLSNGTYRLKVVFRNDSIESEKEFEIVFP